MRSRDNDIANELQEIIPGAAWPGLRPSFGEVPSGYFEQLSDKIMQKIELEEVSPLLAEIPKTDSFSVPEGYFQQLPAQILQKIELEAISPFMAEMPKQFPLTAPEGYFEQLSENIIQKIELEEVSLFMAEMPKQFPLTAPEGYFEQLSEKIMQKIELEEVSPFMAEMPKQFPMSVPAGYFDQLTANVLADVKKKPAKVVPMRRTYFKWAVAASLIAMVSIGTLRFVQQDKKEVIAPAADVSLADVSDQEIVDYLQTHMDAFDKEELLSLASLNNTTNTVPLPETSELSSEAIQSYLDNTGLLKESPIDN